MPKMYIVVDVPEKRETRQLAAKARLMMPLDFFAELGELTGASRPGVLTVSIKEDSQFVPPHPRSIDR